MVWYGMVWYDMVWYGMAWYDMVWYGLVWRYISLSFSLSIYYQHRKILFGFHFSRSRSAEAGPEPVRCSRRRAWCCCGGCCRKAWCGERDGGGGGAWPQAWVELGRIAIDGNKIRNSRNSASFFDLF